MFYFLSRYASRPETHSEGMTSERVRGLKKKILKTILWVCFQCELPVSLFSFVSFFYSWFSCPSLASSFHLAPTFYLILIPDFIFSECFSAVLQIENEGELLYLLHTYTSICILHITFFLFLHQYIFIQIFISKNIWWHFHFRSSIMSISYTFLHYILYIYIYEKVE